MASMYGRNVTRFRRLSLVILCVLSFDLATQAASIALQSAYLALGTLPPHTTFALLGALCPIL